MSFKKIAIGNLYPNFSVIEDDYTAWEGDDYNNFTQIVVDGNLVDAEVTRLQAEYDAQQYARDRQYPEIGDQLDALFHAGVFPAEMAAEIQAVKDKYPK